jgi:hypothetical protein
MLNRIKRKNNTNFKRVIQTSHTTTEKRFYEIWNDVYVGEELFIRLFVYKITQLVFFKEELTLLGTKYGRKYVK